MADHMYACDSGWIITLSGKYISTVLKNSVTEHPGKLHETQYCCWNADGKQFEEGNLFVRKSQISNLKSKRRRSRSFLFLTPVLKHVYEETWQHLKQAFRVHYSGFAAFVRWLLQYTVDAWLTGVSLPPPEIVKCNLYWAFLPDLSNVQGTTKI